MNKTLKEGIILVALFAATLFLMMQINWMQVLHIKSAANTTEKKLGELIWESVKRDNGEIDIEAVNTVIDSIISTICTANDIDASKIQWHVVENSQVNAFALPDGHLVLYSGLITSADNAEELTGVICHEIAHIQHDHVMQKLMKEIGFSVLLSMTTGNGGGEIIGGAVKTLSSSAFDRDNEKEADLSAVDYMQAAEIDCEPFAEFMYKIAKESGDYDKYLTWINSHPDSEDRAAYIVEYTLKTDVTSGKIISPLTWNKGKKALDKWSNYE
tara:strand:+ start:61634 stop:62446 length:813 start_codon:yes stop_codon:yes gene_type:complete